MNFVFSFTLAFHISRKCRTQYFQAHFRRKFLDFNRRKRNPQTFLCQLATNGDIQGKRMGLIAKSGH